MKRGSSLTEGDILNTLTRLALPLMGTSFIQMAYNLIDIMWLGRLSTGAVAAAGVVGNLTWFGQGLTMISQIGVGVHVAQTYGRGEINEAKKYSENGLRLDIIIGLIYALLLFIFKNKIINFFKLDNIDVYDMAIDYLSIIVIGLPFSFMNPVFSNILNSTGDSITPFKVNTVGLIFNIILDPVLIFGFGPIRALGIRGAAIATITAQIIVSLLFIYVGNKNETLYSNAKILNKIDIDKTKTIARTGFPAFLQTAVMSGISMILARIIAAYGAVAVAVQAIGSQIESLSWMTSEGFSAAISAFTGQNYGAGKYDRVDDGYKEGMKVISIIGIIATITLMFGARPIFSLFTPNDPAAIEEGINYLRILSLSQFLMSVEIGTAGLFNGLGKTSIPATVAIIFNALRVPLALLLSNVMNLGLSGVWWTVSITGNIKGIIMASIYIFIVRERLINGEI